MTEYGTLEEAKYGRKRMKAMYRRENSKREQSHGKNRIPERICRLFVLICVVSIFLCFIMKPDTTEAKVNTAHEIRVGLKSVYADKQTITLYNTQLELGYCDGRVYRRETTVTATEGVKVTAEKGTFFTAAEGFTLPEAETAAKRLREAGAAAYAVMFSEGNAGVYLPVKENGATKESARTVCKAAAEKCGITLDKDVTEGTYLIRIDAGERVLFADGVQGSYPQFGALEKNKDGIFAVNLGKRSYRGRIEIGRYGGKTTVTAVNVVPLEDYLYGVVPCEMPASWPAEALKAQAVCARSFALIKAGYHAETDIKRGFRIDDTEQSQVYGGVTFEQKNSSGAVDATVGETLCYENRTVAGYYFSASGGHTENAEDVWGFSLPFLTGVPDIYELNPSKKPWSITIGRDELARLLRSNGNDVGTVEKVTQEVITASGRVYRLRVIGSRGSVSLSTDVLRNVLKLPGTKFKVIASGTVPDSVTVQGAGASRKAAIHDCYVLSGSGEVRKADDETEQYVVLSADNLTNFPKTAPEEGEYLFAGMGAGHGIGMSQSGARGMAEQGFTYREILEHYFTGISVR